jgi:hypothetical protein
MLNYRYLDGMEELLQRLAAGGAHMHAFSNYPEWYRLIEGKLQLSRYLEWTFVSCQGPLKASWACFLAFTGPGQACASTAQPAHPLV